MLIKNYKQIHDNIHGYIKLSNIATTIIDTVEFQRLRYLHQLGTCFYVFPSAIHTRFEHSIGVYHLTGLMLENIKKNSNINDLNKYMENIKELHNYYTNKLELDLKLDEYLDDYVCELVKIAGLCHDLGHGPFSHIFDDVFIPNIKKIHKYNNELDHHELVNNELVNNELDHHEYRSCKILRHIIQKNELLKQIITDDDLQFIENLINPSESAEHKGFIYQIVSNNLNNMDVDKYDYLERDTKNLSLNFGFDSSRLINNVNVIDNIICLPKQMYYDVASIFTTRYRLHKQIYTHKMVLATQYMIQEIMLLLDPIIDIYKSLQNIDSFCNLTDDYIISMVKILHSRKNQYTLEQQESIELAYNIWQNICNRKLYRFVKTIVSYKPIDDDIDITMSTFTDDVKQNIIIYKSKIGFVSDKKQNPFDNLYFYSNKNPRDSFKIKKEQVTYLIPNMFQEYIYTIFIKDRNDTSLEYILLDFFSKY